MLIICKIRVELYYYHLIKQFVYFVDETEFKINKTINSKNNNFFAQIKTDSRLKC